MQSYYQSGDYRIAPLSEWLAVVTALGYTVRRVRHNGLNKLLNLYDVIDQAGDFVVTIIKHDSEQQSRWSCNVTMLFENAQHRDGLHGRMAPR